MFGITKENDRLREDNKELEARAMWQEERIHELNDELCACHRATQQPTPAEPPKPVCKRCGVVFEAKETPYTALISALQGRPASGIIWDEVVPESKPRITPAADLLLNDPRELCLCANCEAQLTEAYDVLKGGMK